MKLYPITLNKSKYNKFMTLTEYINTMAFGIIYGLGGNAIECTQMSMEKAYEKNFFILPRVYCKDGFNISIQIHNGMILRVGERVILI